MRVSVDMSSSLDALFASRTVIDEMINEKLEEHRDVMARTGRKHGAVANTPSVVTKWVMDNVPKSHSILDYGAGLTLCQYRLLRKAGWRDVAACDLWEVEQEWPRNTVLPEIIDTYDVVMLSNVLNVQPCEKEIIDLLNLVRRTSLRRGGTIVMNYPASPRYGGYTRKEIERMIGRAFPSADFIITRHKNNVFTVEWSRT